MSSGARYLNVTDWLRSPSFARCDEDQRADLIAEYLNGVHLRDADPLDRVSIARFGVTAQLLTSEQKVNLMRDVGLSVENSTYDEYFVRRTLALDMLTFSMEILVDQLRYGADDRNEAALIAARMPRIIAQTYSEL